MKKQLKQFNIESIRMLEAEIANNNTDQRNVRVLAMSTVYSK